MSWLQPQPFRFVAALALVGFLVGCGPDGSNGSMFSLLDEEVYDSPGKTQVEQHILALAPPTREELEAETLRRYRAASARTGFRYHTHPTVIAIYVYGDERKAREEQHLWIAMLLKTGLDSSADDPPVKVDEGRLAALSAAPETRFGLAENTRQQIFAEAYAAEQRADDEATVQVPNFRDRDDIQKWNAIYQRLKAKYEAELAAKYGLTEDQLDEVVVEGVMKGWSSQS